MRRSETSGRLLLDRPRHRRCRRRVSPRRSARLAELRHVQELQDAAAEKIGELLATRRPVRGERRRLVEDDEGGLARQRDFARRGRRDGNRGRGSKRSSRGHGAAPRAADRASSRPPGVVEIAEISVSRRRSGDHRIDLVADIGCHQGDKRAKGLAGLRHEAKMASISPPSGRSRSTSGPVSSRPNPRRTARLRTCACWWAVSRSAPLGSGCHMASLRVGRGAQHAQIAWSMSGADQGCLPLLGSDPIVV